MSKLRMLLLLSAAAMVGACSDSQTPSAPSTPSDEGQLTLVLDASSAAVADEDASANLAQGAAELGTGGKGKATTGPRAETISCVHNAWHELCTDIRSGRLRAADGDAIVKKSFVNSTRGELRINGVLWAWTNRFGPVFFGDAIFSRYRNLSIRVFRGDRICSKFTGNPAPQVCGTVR
jgi:hypothetical protein